jgi:MFS transporter, DHA1 family, multidrug resistance protein
MIIRPRRPARLTAWLARWGGVLPLLVAEFIVWVGFGALLPVLPLYFVEQGLDLGTLGFVIAAWPAARLVGEPIFGWLADRTARVPLMVVGLIGTGIFAALPLVLTGPLAFLGLRALSGLSTAVYDPAARGYLADAVPPDRRGEAFGLYGAAQMGGLLFGPAIGAFGAGIVGGITFPFAFSGAAALIAAVAVALRVREMPARTHPAPALDATEFPPEFPATAERAAADVDRDRADGPTRIVRPAPTSLLNRGLLAAVVLNAGGYFATGTYEVIWSLFLQGLGAGLDLIGLTFAMFGLPILILSPYAGRRVDRGGTLWFVIGGAMAAAVAGILYTLITNPLLAVPIILLEATGFAFLNPALYSIVAASSPRGRSSTAQGIYGAAGTVGFILASIIAGHLAAIDIHYPFYLFVAVLLGALVLALAIGRGTFRAGPPAGPAPAPDG